MSNLERRCPLTSFCPKEINLLGSVEMGTAMVPVFEGPLLD
ncbi:MAG: hypothetical protein ACRDWH_01360 [Acidimicrobiia bacterium]